MAVTPSYLPAGSLITTTGGVLIARMRQEARRNCPVPPVEAFEFFVPLVDSSGELKPGFPRGPDGCYWLAPGFRIHVAGFGWWPRPDEDHH